jgi:hypothetical protein
MRVARVFPAHENAIAAKNRRGAVAFGHFLVFEVDLGKNSQAPDDPSDRIPVHLNELSFSWGIWLMIGKSRQLLSF